MFCEVNELTAFASVVVLVITRLLSFIAALYPAITALPKLFMMVWTSMLPTLTKLCCRIEGIARYMNLRNILLSNSFPFAWPFVIEDILFTSTAFARMQLTPWQMNVAHATPSTPIEKAVTKSISMKMFAVEEMARNTNGVLLSPRAEKTPVARL